MATVWFTRYGAEHTGPERLTVDEAKGTASFDYISKCSRCGGAGASDKWKFTGLVCFDCGGHGKGPIRTQVLYTADKLAKLNATQAKRDATKAAKQAAQDAERKAQAEKAAQEFLAVHHAEVEQIKEYAERNAFLGELFSKFEQFGKLSTGQLEAAQTAILRCKTLEASQFVGITGERAELTLTIERVIKLESYGPYATPYLHLCRDSAGNRVVNKGAGNFPGEGQTVRVKATIGDHTNYKGENQTYISRPKVIEV